MSMDYLLLPLLSLAWTFVAVVVADARQKHVSIFHFFMCGSLVALLAFLALNLFYGMEDFFAPHFRASMTAFTLGACFNTFGQAVAMYNLKKGGRALAFAIPQLAFILPYGWSIIFWNEKFTCAGAAGLLLIIGAICFLSAKKSAVPGNAVSSSLDLRRILTAFSAMTIIGVSQICMAYSAQLPAAERLSPLRGSLVIQVVGTLLFTLFSIFAPVKFSDGVKKAAKYSILWGIGAILSYCLLLPALEVLGRRGQTGIVYPVVCSMLIMLFTLYAALRYKEKLTVSQTAAFTVIIAGILLIRL